MPIAFISYAKEDVLHARRLYASLRSQGVTVWFDEESLLPGQNWRHSIQTAIAECRYFIALLSSKSVSKKGFVQKELKIALDILDQHPSGEVYIVPVRLEDCEVADPKLREIHYVDFFPDYEFGFSRLLRAIRETSVKAVVSAPLGTEAPSKTASPEQLDSAKQFFAGIGAKQEAILQRASDTAAENAIKSQRVKTLVAEIERQLSSLVGAYNAAAGKGVVEIQFVPAPPDVVEQLGAYRSLVSFGTAVHWLLRFVTYPNGVLALQLVRVKGKSSAKATGDFGLTNDSINLVLEGEQFWVSLNSAISADLTAEVVRDMPRERCALELLPERATLLVRRAIEFELVRSGARTEP